MCVCVILIKVSDFHLAAWLEVQLDHFWVVYDMPFLNLCCLRQCTTNRAYWFTYSGGYDIDWNIRVTFNLAVDSNCVVLPL